MKEIMNETEVWTDAMVDSLNELATDMLGFDEGKLVEIRDEMPDSMIGAHVAMVSIQEALSVGFISDKEGCNALARALLCMEPDEELPESDVADALGEIVNIIAGGVKRRLVERDASIKIGLPVYFSGKMKPTKNTKSKVLEVQLGTVHAQLFLMLEGE